MDTIAPQPLILKSSIFNSTPIKNYQINYELTWGFIVSLTSINNKHMTQNIVELRIHFLLCSSEN